MNIKYFDLKAANYNFVYVFTLKNLSISSMHLQKQKTTLLLSNILYIGMKMSIWALSPKHQLVQPKVSQTLAKYWHFVTSQGTDQRGCKQITSTCTCTSTCSCKYQFYTLKRQMIYAKVFSHIFFSFHHTGRTFKLYLKV